MARIIANLFQHMTNIPAWQLSQSLSIDQFALFFVGLGRLVCVSLGCSVVASLIGLGRHGWFWR